MMIQEEPQRSMTGHSGHARYGSLFLALHWVMLLLIAAVCVCIELRGYFPKTGSTVFYVLIGLHAAVAPFHHRLIRENTLQRMLPRRAGNTA